MPVRRGVLVYAAELTDDLQLSVRDIAGNDVQVESREAPAANSRSSIREKRIQKTTNVTQMALVYAKENE